MSPRFGIALGIAALAVGSTAAGQSAHAAGTQPGIAHCLVGTWRDTHVLQDVLFQNHLVVVQGKGRDIDHIHANGIDRNDWSNSRALRGSIDSSPLREVVRGVNRVQFTMGAEPRTFSVNELGWSGANTATFTYQGQSTTQPNQQSGTGNGSYRCTATQLTWFNAHGDVTGQELRLSRKP
jgi:hypothetical protein